MNQKENNQVTPTGPEKDLTTKLVKYSVLYWKYTKISTRHFQP